MSFWDLEIEVNVKKVALSQWEGHCLLVQLLDETADTEILEDLFSEFAPRGFFVLGLGSDSDAELSFPVATESASLQEYFRMHLPRAWESGVKVLVNPAGEIVGAFGPEVEADDDAVLDTLEEYLPI